MEVTTRINKEVITRLRASQWRAIEEARKLGRKAGRGWSEEEAGYKELCRLFREFDKYYDRGFGENPALEFWETIDPLDDRGFSYRREFWKRFTGEDAAPDGVFVDAFVHGALEVWEEVKPQL